MTSDGVTKLQPPSRLPASLLLAIAFNSAKCSLHKVNMNRLLRELPPDVVAHCMLHEFLRLAEKGHDKREVERTLLKFRPAFASSPGSYVLAGALAAFASHAHIQAETHEAPQLRNWLEPISRLFSGDPQFEILIKVFDVMVRYKESGDERVLLELPLEQRQLLESRDVSAPLALVNKAKTFSH